MMQTGLLAFAGTRQVDGQLLALLKRSEEVMVLRLTTQPLDASNELPCETSHRNGGWFH